MNAFGIGGGFTFDDNLVVSDQTFLKLYPQRVSGAPNHILVKLEPDAIPTDVISDLRAVLPDYDSTEQTIDAAVSRDQNFQSTHKPVGLVFGFGATICVMVGIIIVYQVLSTDVADHIREYAAFKAMDIHPVCFLGLLSKKR